MSNVKKYEKLERVAMDYFMATGGRDLSAYGMVAAARELKQKELENQNSNENGFGM